MLNKDRLERIYESQSDPSINALPSGQMRKHVEPSHTCTDPIHGDMAGYSKKTIDTLTTKIVIGSHQPTFRLPSGRFRLDLLAYRCKCTHQRARISIRKALPMLHHFFLPRARQALAALWRGANSHSDPRIRHMLLFFVEQAIWGMSILNRYRPTGYSQVNRQLTGVYYVSSQISEVSPRYNLGNKLSRLINAFGDARSQRISRSSIVTARHGRVILESPMKQWITFSPTRHSEKTSTTRI